PGAPRQARAHERAAGVRGRPGHRGGAAREAHGARARAGGPHLPERAAGRVGDEDGDPPGARAAVRAGGGDRRRLPGGERAVGGLPRGAARLHGEAQAGVEGSMTRAIGLRAALWIALGLLAVGCKRDEKEANPYIVAPPDVSAQIHALGEDTMTADDAAEQLEQMGPVVIPALAAALVREPKDVRQKAGEGLETVGTPAAVPPVLAAAEHDADDDVRSDALRALGTIGDPRGRPLVEAALGDPKLSIRGAGITSCANLCTSPQAIERLADIAVHDESPAAARAARATLATIRKKGPTEDQVVRSAIERRRPA